MKIENYKKRPAREVKIEGASGVKLRWLITDKDGATSFAMRLFEISPEGHTPLHTHDFEHGIFILRGEGFIRSTGKETQFRTGDVIFVPPNEEHQFVNKGKSSLKFICLVPSGKG